jgi:hypothetical protein
MITLQTDDITNDLVYLNGNLIIISETAQIRQAIKEALGTFFGEWFLDTTVGVPWFQQILVSHPNLDVIQALLINAILSVPGVAQLNSFEFGYNKGNRSLSVSFEAVSSNGQTINLNQTVGI